MTKLERLEVKGKNLANRAKNLAGRKANIDEQIKENKAEIAKEKKKETEK